VFDGVVFVEVTSLSVSGRTDWAGGRWARIESVASVGNALAVSVFETVFGAAVSALYGFD
jgi:hypothetical protein